ncbi:hypothetical protein JCM12298_20130 [Desulfothermus naphthae]
MKFKSILFILVILLALVPYSYAKYEIDKSNVTCNVPTDGKPTPLDTDLRVEWKKPQMSGDDILHGFVYKWNNSSEQLTDEQLNANNKDDIVNKDVDPTFVSLPYDQIKDDDYNDLRYLHVKTWYLDSSTGKPAYSNDVVIGPINIDNVSPQGTVRIVDKDGNDIDSTKSTTLNLKLGASKDTVKMCINEANTPPREDSDYVDYSDSAVYTLNDTTPGGKTIYVWFKDQAGNISQPVYDTVELSPKAIDPYKKTIDLASQTTQTFSVSGTQGKYNWEIIEEKPQEQGKDVAKFKGESQNINSVVVELLNPGTFKLKATTVNDQNEVLTSGTIKVIKSVVFTLDIDNNGVCEPLKDGLLILRYLFGFTGNTLINGAVATDAQRKTATDIENYIKLGKDQKILDIDDNGVCEPLKDGLLILRYLFGFTGNTLINGAVATDAQRKTATDIEKYIKSLKISK